MQTDSFAGSTAAAVAVEPQLSPPPKRRIIYQQAVQSTFVAAKLPLLLLVLLLVGSALWTLKIAHGTSFWSDEWGLIVEHHGFTFDSLFKGINGHLPAGAVLAYKALIKTFGIQSYLPFLLALIACHWLVMSLIFTYARRRVGAWMALGLTALVTVYGVATEVLVYPVHLVNELALASGIAALLLLDNARRRNDVIACTALIFGLLCSSMTIPFLIPVAVAVLGQWRRWWVFVVPSVLYLGWSAIFSEASVLPRNVAQLWSYSSYGLARSVGGLFAFTDDWGRPLALLFAIAIGFAIVRARPFPQKAVGLVLAIVGFWFITTMTRAQLGLTATERYWYPTAVLIVLLIAEVARGRKLPDRLIAPAVVALGAIVLANLYISKYQVVPIRAIGQNVSGAMRALALNDRNIDVNAGVGHVPVYGVSVKRLQTVMKRYGSPDGPPASLVNASGTARRSADLTLRNMTVPLTVAFTKVEGKSDRPRVISVNGGSTHSDGGCQVFHPNSSPAQVELALPINGAIIETTGSEASILTRRFADEYQPTTVVAPNTKQLLRLSASGGLQPWRAVIQTTTAVRVCAPL